MIEDRKSYNPMTNKHYVIWCDDYTIGAKNAKDAEDIALKELENGNTITYNIYDRIKRKVVGGGTIGTFRSI